MEDLILKSILKSNKYRILLFIGIVSCCLLILGFSSFLSVPEESIKPLELLCLNQETEPVFHISSQSTYNHDAIQHWLAEPSLPIWNVESVGVDEVPILNLMFPLDSTDVDIEQIVSDIERLAPYFAKISLSVFPNEDIQIMDDTTYLDFYFILYSSLLNRQLSSVKMIAYPRAHSDLSLYDKDYIDSVGSTLREQADLKTLDAVYTYFSTKKSLVVLDQIKAFSQKDVQTVLQEITASYYLMAIQYPAVEQIFSPCIKPSLVLSNNDVLNGNDADFYMFDTIYKRLLAKPWITTSSHRLSNQSPYQTINDYDTVSGKIELIVAPNAEILKMSSNSDSASSIFFKWNDTFLNINSSYPYTISIDTCNEPNGISRVNAIVQNAHQETIDVYGIDLMVENTSTQIRAPRVASETVININYIKPSHKYIPILMYHTVEDEVLPEKQNSHVETEVFDSQMKALIENGYTPINFYDLKNYVDGLVSLPEHPILITMDDGYLNNYTNAYPIYKKYNIQATLFVSPYYMEMENTDRHFGWIAAQEMEDSGLIDIQPHGYDHTPLPYLSLKDARYHASHAKGIIEKYLGTRDVSVLAYPQFRHNRHTVKILNELGFDFQIINLAKKGILPNDAAFNPPKLKRINVPNTMTPEELLKTLDEITS